jgi:two-component system, OmpR family, phosphate regulon sensor histidine kinase PhoR
VNRGLTIPGIFDRMKKNYFLLVVLINSAALIGIIVTQFFWIRNAYGLLVDEFDASVRVALKGVVNQLPANDIKLISNNLGQLEHRLNEELVGMEIHSTFEFAIIDTVTRAILTGKYSIHEKELMTSIHRANLLIMNTPSRYVLTVYFPGQQAQIIMKMLNWILVLIIFTVVLIIGFPVSIYIFNRQKRISGMKSDFINNMTHEFKTPIATISLASEMLQKQSIHQDPAKILKYSKVIFDENMRLQNHVEQILSVSMLERGQFRLKKRDIDIHQLISEIVDNFGLSVKEQGGVIKTHYCANRFIIKADKSHLTNVIINLLDNASKYSQGKPWIRIGTQNISNGLTISVEDRGIGISLENQHQIFNNLYRVPTGNLYNVKGFGIGLFYVKTIVEAHGGHINLKSELNKGSRFDVHLPFDYNSSKYDDYTQT